MGWLKRRVVLPILMFFVGCGAPQSVLQVNHLDGEAAFAIRADVAKLRETVTSPAEVALLDLVDRRAATIAAGSAVLANYLGTPREPAKYSIENHERWIVVAVDEVERNKNMIDAAIGAVETAAKWVGGAVAGLGFIATLVGYIRKARQLSASEVVAELKDKTIGVMVRGVQKAERDGTSPAKEIAKEADTSDMKSEVRAEVLDKQDPTVVTTLPGTAPPPVVVAPAPIPGAVVVEPAAVLVAPVPAPAASTDPVAVVV